MSEIFSKLDNYLVFVFPHLKTRLQSLVACCIPVSFQTTVSTRDSAHPTFVSWSWNLKLSLPPCCLLFACLFFKHRRMNVLSVCIRPAIWTRDRVNNCFVCLHVQWLLEEFRHIVLRMQLLLLSLQICDTSPTYL